MQRLKKKQGQIDANNKEIQGFLGRGAIRELTQQEMDAWQGPVNYISHHRVPKPGSSTTPMGAMSNSSFNNNYSSHSYNSLLANWTNALPPLLEVLVNFRF